MAEAYRLLAHPELGKQLQGLSAAAEKDPNSSEAQEFAAVKDGLKALRQGTEASQGGKQMHALADQYGDISDCAEIKVPVVQEYGANNYPLGPSHRLTYREFEGTSADPTPVREAIAFEPRAGGRPFQVTADRLDRPVGVSLADLGLGQASGQGQSQDQQQQQSTGQQQDQQGQQQGQQGQQGQQQGTRRQALPSELAAAARAATDIAAGKVTAPAQDPTMAQRLAAMSFSQPASQATRGDAARGAASSDRGAAGQARSGQQQPNVQSGPGR